MLKKLLRNNVAGDTIVEVMLALAILGLVLGGAYIVTNQSTLNERRAQERNIALQLAQGQIESMKQFASIHSFSSAMREFANLHDIPSPAKDNVPFCMAITSTTNSITKVTTTKASLILTSNSYYDPGNNVDTACYVDSSGNQSFVQPVYHLSEQLIGSSTTTQNCSSDYACTYKVNVNWPDVDGKSMDVLTLYYKLYS